MAAGGAGERERGRGWMKGSIEPFTPTSLIFKKVDLTIRYSDPVRVGLSDWPDNLVLSGIGYSEKIQKFWPAQPFLLRF